MEVQDLGLGRRFRPSNIDSLIEGAIRETFYSTQKFPIVSLSFSLENSKSIEEIREVLNKLPGKTLYKHTGWGNDDLIVIYKKILIVIGFYSDYGIATEFHISFYGHSLPNIEISKILDFLKENGISEAGQDREKPKITFTYPARQGEVMTVRKEFESLPFSSIQKNYSTSVQLEIQKLLELNI